MLSCCHVCISNVIISCLNSQCHVVMLSYMYSQCHVVILSCYHVCIHNVMLSCVHVPELFIYAQYRRPHTCMNLLPCIPHHTYSRQKNSYRDRSCIHSQFHTCKRLYSDMGCMSRLHCS